MQALRRTCVPTTFPRFSTALSAGGTGADSVGECGWWLECGALVSMARDVARVLTAWQRFSTRPAATYDLAMTMDVAPEFVSASAHAFDKSNAWRTLSVVAPMPERRRLCVSTGARESARLHALGWRHSAGNGWDNDCRPAPARERLQRQVGARRTRASMTKQLTLVLAAPQRITTW